MFQQRECGACGLNGNPEKVVQAPVAVALPCQVAVAGRADLTEARHLQFLLLLSDQRVRCVILDKLPGFSVL